MTRRPTPRNRTLRPATVLLASLLLSIAAPAHALSAREIAEMKQLTPTDRMIQVCFLKLEDRISKETRYRRVDRIVMDAFSRGKVAGRTVRAAGAAFRDRGNWFKLRFRCSVTPDRLHVETVEYQIVSRKPVPRGEWEDHWLFP
ncbi:DUF930 domain-containing protein [Aureimonas flava]|nr:DUF930 domain-containing protein [Aureimonas flava]